MTLIPRGLFKERINSTQSEKDIFNLDIRNKILKLFNDFNLNHLCTPSVAVLGGRSKNDCLELMKSKLKYLIDEERIRDFESIFLGCSVNDLLSCVELYTKCMQEIINSYEKHLGRRYGRCDTSNIIYTFIESFDNLLDYHKIPYRFTYNSEQDKLFIENKFNEVEEETKKKVFEIIKSEPKINEHFTQSLSDYARKNFKESIGSAYLTLEKYLKFKTENHKLDANKNFIIFRGKYSFKEKGIFSVRPDILEKKISIIFSIRSELTSHSAKDTFDTNKFLEETARFQLNEVMNCIILLEELSK